MISLHVHIHIGEHCDSCPPGSRVLHQPGLDKRRLRILFHSPCSSQLAEDTLRQHDLVSVTSYDVILTVYNVYIHVYISLFALVGDNVIGFFTLVFYQISNISRTSFLHHCLVM